MSHTMHGRGQRQLIRMVGAALLTLPAVAGLSVPSDAAALVGCWGDYCSGKDPATTGCSADGVTVASQKLYAVDVWLDLRWSPTCKTNWARLRGSNSIKQIKAIQPSTGYSQGRSGGNPWSLMIYSPTLCVYAWVDTPWQAVSTACVA